MLTNPKKKRKSGKKRNPKLHIVKRKSSRRGGFQASSHKPRRRNPGRMSGALQKLNITSALIAGGSAIAGGLLTRAIPQQVLKAKNTGILGYGANLIVAVGGFLAARHFTKRPEIAYGILAGGVAATMLRVYSERISQSSVNLLAEMGDVEFSSDGLGALGEYLQRQTPDSDNRGGKFKLPANAVQSIPQATATGSSSVAVTDMASDRFRSRFSAAS
ncbi:MAG TPA: hypothetical protein VH024_00265 [Candidatus Angelobacter sp.]|jgi:hypothetical protein|nr:hypothetical protein [Candidatus Angelobacter sp.]